MLFQQFLDDDLGCASYLVGDEEAGVAAIVDPPYAVERVLAEAAKRGVEIVRVVETHTHADHLSGHGRLALELGIPISIHPAAEDGSGGFPWLAVVGGVGIALAVAASALVVARRRSGW